MFNLKAIIIAGATMLCSIGAVAQEESSIEGGYLAEAQELGYLPYPYNFIQVQGGFGTTFTDVSCWKLLTPTYSFAVGRMFTPIIGTRLHVNGWKAKGGFDDYLYVGEQRVTSSSSVLKYKYSYINTDIDMMVNVFNIFSKKVHRPFDIYMIAGLGINCAWHNKQFAGIVDRYEVGSDISNAWGPNQNKKNLLSHNIRLGLLADVNIAKHWSVGAEVDFNSMNDRFNSKYKNADDWMMTGQLSLTYKFGFKEPPTPKTPAVTPPPVYQNTQQTETVPTPAPRPVVTETPVKETIFYALRESDLTSDRESICNKVVEWCKKYPNKTITVSGYADKGTGNPKLNEGYAQQRAEKVADMLKKKGVPASQMVVKSYGDTVQPFADNDKNRCVIIEGK